MKLKSVEFTRFYLVLRNLKFWQKKLKYFWDIFEVERLMSLKPELCDLSSNPSDIVLNLFVKIIEDNIIFGYEELVH